MRWQIAVVGLAALTCLGFAEPKMSPQFVRLDFVRTYMDGNTKSRALDSGYNLYYEPTCRHEKFAGFGLLTSSKSSLTVPGDVRLFVEAVAGNSSKECKAYVGFQADRSHTYAVRLSATQEGCRVDVIDNATGQRPAGLRFFDGMHQCSAYLNQRD